MINIRPVSDLRNKYPEVEAQVLQNHEPVFLTKNGYGSMVLMSLEQYADITGDMENRLMEADAEAAATTERYSLDEAFDLIRRQIDETRV